MNHAPRKPTLEDRFTQFIDDLPNAEIIDRLELPKDLTNTRKADFLLKNREVIIEMKTLTADPSSKIEATVDEHRDREDFPVVYGSADVRRVFSFLSDGEDIYRRMVLSLTRSVESGLRSAEEQIAHTKAVLRLPDSVGVLVVLNESVSVLDPELVGHRVAQHWRRRQQSGNGASQIDFVWLLFESHTIATNSGLPASISMLIRGETANDFPWFPDFHQELNARWATFNGMLYLDQGNPKDLKSLKFSPTGSS